VALRQGTHRGSREQATAPPETERNQISDDEDARSGAGVLVVRG
jgi:hypothetical protein